MTKRLGLIGNPLSHSFSKQYFEEKFRKEHITGWSYDLFALESIEGYVDLIAQNADIIGLNVTIPYKQQVIPHLDLLDKAAEDIGAVNTIVLAQDGKSTGYNTDYIGFRNSLLQRLRSDNESTHTLSALVLGTGGSSKAIEYALRSLDIPRTLVSRRAGKNMLSYDQLTSMHIAKNRLIINTTPLGMHPKIDTAPDIPYDALGPEHLAYDLVYNPEETLFMKKSKLSGARVLNGYSMLTGQAEAAWDIWNDRQS